MNAETTSNPKTSLQETMEEEASEVSTVTDKTDDNSQDDKTGHIISQKADKINSFRDTSKRAIKDKGYLFLCFIIPLGLMWLMYIARHTYPFGNESVLVLDLNAQYIYFYEALRAWFHGEGSLLYSFGRALGGEFLGIFAYYIASPLTFIVALFPKQMITEALLLIFLLKTGASGLTFGIYLTATRKRDPVANVIFSTMYALTAYAVVQQHNSMWIDCLVLLPLILLGIEQMIKFGKYKLYVISLSVAIFSSYYIGYMTCIFVAAYFFYYYFTNEPAERNPLGIKNHFIKSLFRIGVFSIITVCIASIIILPAYYSLQFGKTTFSNPSFGFGQKFDWLDGLSKLYFGSYDTVRPEGLPFISSGMLTLLLVPLYFLAPHIKIREKIGGAFLILFFFLSFNSTTIDLIWHGFQTPNWLNYRYSFMLTFVLILFAYKAFEEICRIGYRPFLLSAAFASLLILILQKLELSNIPDLECVWASMAFIGLYVALMRACTHPDQNTRETGALVLALVVFLEMFCGGLYNQAALDGDVVYTSRSSYRDFQDRVQPIVDTVKENDTSFYRMEKTLHRRTNDNMALGIRGLSNSTSTLNTKVIDWLNRAGMCSHSHWSKYLGGTPVLDSVTGIKYLIADYDEDVSPLYEYMFSDVQNNLQAYRNPYALSIAFGVNDEFDTFVFDNSKYKSPFERLNNMVSAMVGSESTLKLFRKTTIKDIGYNSCDVSMVVGHKKYTPAHAGKYSAVTFTLIAESNEMLYCYFPSDYPRECSVTVNGTHVGQFFGNESFCIKQLGRFEKDETVDVTLQLTEDELYLATNEAFFFYLDEEVFRDAFSKLDDSQFVIESFTEDSFKGTVDVKEGKTIIYTSIPYDKGWVVKVDGEPVELVMLMDCFLGFKTTPGTHTLTLDYKPDCVHYGTILCLFGLTAFAAVWIGETIMLIRKKKDTSPVAMKDGDEENDENKKSETGKDTTE